MTYLGSKYVQASMVETERLIVDYFEKSGADVEQEDGEWFAYVNDGDGKVSLTGLAAALTSTQRDTGR